MQLKTSNPYLGIKTRLSNKGDSSSVTFILCHKNPNHYGAFGQKITGTNSITFSADQLASMIIKQSNISDIEALDLSKIEITSEKEQEKEKE